jgi:hypothetical protein
MATANSTASNKNAGVNELRQTLEYCDSLSQKALEEISAISRLASAALKANPDARARFDHVIIVLGAIESRSDDTMYDINAAAERVGCNYRAEASHA